MSAFYASRLDKVAAVGDAHNASMRKRYPRHEDQVGALNLNVRSALVGDAQVGICSRVPTGSREILSENREGLVCRGSRLQVERFAQ